MFLTMQYRPSGANHYNWKGSDIAPKIGRQRCRRIFKVIGPCSRCGSKKSERHHIDGNPCNNVPENISILCRKCHMLVDKRIEKFATPFTNGLAKLDFTKAREIRTSRESGPVLAARYGVSNSLISLVRLNRIWKEPDFDAQPDAYSDYLVDITS